MLGEKSTRGRMWKALLSFREPCQGTSVHSEVPLDKAKVVVAESDEKVEGKSIAEAPMYR